MTADEPYCRNCNYNLTGLRNSSKCPECGLPLVEVLTRKSFTPAAFAAAKRYKSAITLWGLPLVHVALGPGPEGMRGKATGIIAIGDVARGFVAIGGVAMGVVAIGGLGLGLFSVAGMSVGALAIGGWAVGGITLGGGAFGLIAVGGGAVGLIAAGGGAIGYYAAGGGVYGKYVLGPAQRDPQAQDMFNRLSWLIGNLSGGVPKMLGWMVLVLAGLLMCIGALVLLTYIRNRPRTES